VLLFAATGFVGSLQAALDRIWEAPPSTGGVWAFIRAKLFSFSLVLGAAFLLLVSLVLSTAMTALAGNVTTGLGLSEGIAALVIAAANFVLAALIFAAIALAWYLGREAQASAYGGATSLVLLLVWVYYSAQIVFLGAQFSQTLQTMFRAAAHQQPSRHRSVHGSL
jgi:membrane protein